MVHNLYQSILVHVRVRLPCWVVRLHVRRQCRPTCECLVAAWVFALIRTFARMCPTMTSETTGVPECLPALRVLAEVWFLPGMHTKMDVQRRSL